MFLRFYQFSLFLIDLLNFLGKAIIAILQAIITAIIPPAKKSVQDDVVLITGGGQGLGREMAMLFAKLGSKIVLWDISEECVHKTATEIQSSTACKAYAYKCDVSNRDDVMRIAQKVKEDVGQVTILINNAGVLPCYPFLQLNHHQIQRCMEVNTMAHFWTLQAFLPAMIDSGKGHIVCVSSMAGKSGHPNQVAYCTSKYAVTGMMTALSEELRYYKNDGVKVSTVHPIIMNTTLAQRPRVKYNFLFPIIDVKYAAQVVVDGVLRNEKAIYIPRHLTFTNKLMTIIPHHVLELFFDFLGYGLDPHDK
jgi:all-trans-retinol dehydrogenase (NAD+)